jgi:DNA-directed RNA polymerase subunit RPC12/RpoP
MEQAVATITEFKRRRRMFYVRGIMPVVLLILFGCIVMWKGLPDDKPIVLLANLVIFAAGIWYVISAKRYYRCPACEKVVVPTKADGKPSDISFGIDYSPEECPYCKVKLG